MQWGSLLVTLLTACRSPGAPAGATSTCPSRVPHDAAASTAAREPTPGAAPPGARESISPLTTHEIFWSPKSDLVATNATWGRGLPGGGPEGSELVVLEASTGTKRASHPTTSIFGFRADGAWLVVGSASGKGIEEWSPRTGETRPSVFADATRDARAFCIAPDDRHLLVLRHHGEGEGYDELVVRTRDTQDEISLDGSLMSSVATDCAFAPDGKRIALAFPDGVIVYSLLGDETAKTTWRATFPLPKASHLAWSMGGNELSFAGADAPLISESETRPSRLAIRWRLKDNQVRSALHVTTGAIDRAGGLVGHDGCGWVRVAPGAATWSTFAVTDPNGYCVTSRARDVVLSPNGRFVAALLESRNGHDPIVGRAP